MQPSHLVYPSSNSPGPTQQREHRWDLDNALITPHVAGDTPTYMRKATLVFVENYATRQREGRLTTEVDVARGY